MTKLKIKRIPLRSNLVVRGDQPQLPNWVEAEHGLHEAVPTVPGLLIRLNPEDGFGVITVDPDLTIWMQGLVSDPEGLGKRKTAYDKYIISIAIIYILEKKRKKPKKQSQET